MTWLRACSRAELADGELHGYDLGENAVLIVETNGAIFACDNVCTHAFALLSDGFLDGTVVECPLHGAKYDVRSGACLAVADTGLTTYDVRVDGNDVFVSVG